jgi:hypothetical protein
MENKSTGQSPMEEYLSLRRSRLENSCRTNDDDDDDVVVVFL